MLAGLLPAVATAFLSVANGPVRNRATIGGTAFPWPIRRPNWSPARWRWTRRSSWSLPPARAKLSAAEFFATPRRVGEVIAAMTLPCRLPGERHGFAEFTNRASGGKARALAFARMLPGGEPRLTVAGDPRLLRAGERMALRSLEES